jgi:hypothetical protein
MPQCLLLLREYDVWIALLDHGACAVSVGDLPSFITGAFLDV